MQPLFSSDDVSHWRQTNSRSLGILNRRLNDLDWRRSTDAQALNMLALNRITSAYINLHEGDEKQAVACLEESVQIKTSILKLHLDGDEKASRYLQAGSFQSILYGYAASNRKVVNDFMIPYEKCFDSFTSSPASSLFLGFCVKGLARKDFESVIGAFNSGAPREAEGFKGYNAIIHSLCHHDEEEFLGALEGAEQEWYNLARKKLKGQPEAVCFLQGFGFLNLAEYIFGKQLSYQLAVFQS